MVPGSDEDRPWCDTKAILDKVHSHVCGHSSFSDMNVLLRRNEIWNADIEKYLSQVLETCPTCKTPSKPKTPRKVSLSSLNRHINKDVCINHLYLCENIVFHAMKATVRYSAGGSVPDTSVKHAIVSFETHWVAPFWHPGTVIFDPAFNNSIFTSYLRKCDIELRSLPPRRHNRNVFESKHRIIRDICLRLKSSSNGDPPEELLIQKPFVYQMICTGTTSRLHMSLQKATRDRLFQVHPQSKSQLSLLRHTRKCWPSESSH